MMNTRIRLLALSLFAAVLWPTTTVDAATCEIPMIAQQVAVPPNVMILVDNSGSMNEVMWHEDFDNSDTFTGTFDPATMYSVGWEGDYTFNGNTVRLVVGLHGMAGRYLGNYLNWLFHVADADQRANAPQLTRQEVANTAVKAVINTASGLRYGLARFDFWDGAVIDSNCGTAVATIESEIDAMPADSWTPSGEALYDLLEHFRDQSGPIQYSCQKNFVIFVTDGLPTMDRDVPLQDQDGDDNEPGSCAGIGAPYLAETNDCSDYMDDVAHYMANNDLRADLDGDQHVYTYTIGFGVDAPILADTAENGEGLYRLAWDLDTLIAELGTVVGDIVNRISSGAAVAVVSTETGTDDRLYRGKFLPGDWQGYLEAFALPYENGDSPVWEAGSKLRDRDWDTRDLFTFYDGAKHNFDDGNLDELAMFIAPNGPGSGLDFEDGYGVDFDDAYNDGPVDTGTDGPDFDEDYVEDVIDFVRGRQLGNSYRDRNGWKLGDLVYSTPVVVGPPAGYHSDLDFHEFATNLENRTPVVYVGANDGMLHAFKASTGEEMWAFLPQNILPKLELLADVGYCHTAMVDLSPRAYDTKINGQWRTVIFGGQRTGGDSYFALDVTDPDQPDVLWETRIPKMETSFTEPVLIESKYGPVLWVGSGPATSGEAYASAIDAATGNIVLSGRVSSIGGLNALTAPTAYDVDFDGYADVVYQGDLGGDIHRFVIDSADPDDWWKERLFDGSEPITGRPAVAIDDDGVANIIFGTGQFLEAADFTDASANRFYCIKEPGLGVTLDPGDLTNRTSDTSDATIDDGWYIWLDNGGGERVTEPAVGLEGVVYFTSYRPSTQPCSAGGASWLYRVQLDGGAPVDSDDDGDIDDESRSETIGTGVASRPVVNLAGEELIVQTSDARLTIEELSIAPEKVLIRAWRERFEDATSAPQTEEE